MAAHKISAEKGQVRAMEQFDILIIGAGAVGCAAARELSRFRFKIGVLEKELDVACGNSGRNTGMLHAGFTYKPGTLKAECAVEGNREFDQVAGELDVPFKRTGKLVVGFSETDWKNLLKYKEIGEINGVEGIRLLDKEELSRMAPEAGGEFAMYVPSSGILDPIQYTIALAENACQNGVRFHFGERVTDIVREEDHWLVCTEEREFKTRWVVNCAGMYASRISAMLGYPDYPVKGFKGEYFVLDKKAGKNVKIPIYPAPNEKGGFATHATPTVDGNILIGPDSYLTEEYEDYKNTAEHMDGLIRDGKRMFSETKREYFIRNFAGIRWKRYDPATGEVLDFKLEADPKRPGTVNMVGIESPGITCALPLGRRAAALIAGREGAEENPDFCPVRRGIRRFSQMSLKEQEEAVRENPDYGQVVCRCETVTRAELLAAIHNPLGVHTLTGIKNRTRATMGRCQGGYCETKIAHMIEEELGIPETEVLYSRKNSRMFAGKVREAQ